MVYSENSHNNIRSQSLDLLRFPLAVIIVFIHTVATRSYFDGYHNINLTSIEGADFFYRLTDAFLRGQSVPIYFFIAGYVFFLGLKLTMPAYGRKLKNRYHTLMLPYLLWNIAAVLFTFIMYVPELKSILRPETIYKLDFSLASILECFWNSWYGIFHRIQSFPVGNDIFPQDYPLWFVRDLMIIVMTAPCIYWIFQTSRWYAVTILGVIWILLSPYKLGHVSQLLTGYFFFMWGGYMSYNKRDMIQEFRKRTKIAVIGYIFLGLAHVAASYYNTSLCPILKSMNAFAGMIMAYGISCRLLEKKIVRVNTFLASASFFVYAAHGIFIAYLNILFLTWIKPQNFVGLIIVYVLSSTLIILILLGLYWLLGKYIPKIQLLLGGRSWIPKGR